LDQKEITYIPHKDNKDNCHIKNKYVHTCIEVHANLKTKYIPHKAYVHKTKYISKFKYISKYRKSKIDRK